MTKKKKRIRWGKFIGRFILLTFIIMAIAYGVLNLLKEPSELMQLNFGTVPLTSSHSGIILRDEMVVSSLNSGFFTPDVLDGERVKRHQRIGILEVLENVPTTSANEELAPSNFLVDLESLQVDADAIYHSLISALKSKRFADAEQMKRELHYKLDRLKKLEGGTTQNAFHLRAAGTSEVGNANATVGQSLGIAASESGLVSFYLDGFEETLKYENRYQIDYDELFNQQISPVNKAMNAVRQQESLFKIVRTDAWYIAAQIPIEEFDLFSKGSRVMVTLYSERLEARVEEVFASDAIGVLILRLNQQAAVMHNHRKIELTLVRDEVKGLLVPKESLVTKDGQPGVYTVDLNGLVVFKPVGIIATREEDYVVQDGSFSKTLVNGKTERIASVRHGDKIIRHAIKKSEGDSVAE
jgi:hypothetical protein